MCRVVLLMMLPTAAWAFSPSLSSEGMPLHWTVPRVSLNGVDDDGTLAQACQAWSQLPEARVELVVGGGDNLVHFETESWKYGAEMLAVTVLDVHPDSGEIVRARVEVNRVSYHITNDGSRGSYDLGAVLTHELGHVLGLAHSTDTQATMFAATAPDDTHQRQPQPDDRAGLAFLYDGTSASSRDGGTESALMPPLSVQRGCSLTSVSRPVDGWALCALVFCALTLRWRYRQAGARPGVITMTKTTAGNRDRRASRAL